MHSLLNILLLTLFHSVWQSALLWIFFEWYLKKKLHSATLLNKGILGIILVQLFFSTITAIFLARSDNESLLTFFQLSTNSVLITFELARQCYIALFSIKLIFGLHSWYHFRKLTKIEMIHPELAWLSFLQHNKAKMSIHKEVALGFSDKISIPVTFGYFKPVILIPLAFVNRISASSMEMIILHELSHIKNNDFITNIFLMLVEQLYCLNPIIFLLVKKWRYYAELSCDQLVLSNNYTEGDYAQTLYNCSRYHLFRSLPANAFIGQDKELLNRIRSLSGKIRHPLNRFANIATALLVALIICLPAFLSNTNPSNPTFFGQQHNINSTVSPSPILNNKSNQYVKTLPAFKEKKQAALPTNHKSLTKNNSASTKTTQIQNDEWMHTAHNKSNQLLHQVLKSNWPVEKKEMIIREEDPSSGVSVVKIYHLVKKSGIWTAELAGIIIEKTEQEDAEEQ